MPEIVPVLTNILITIAIAAGARSVVVHFERIPYSAILILIGLVLSFAGIDFRIGLSSDVILFLVLPVILVRGTVDIDVEQYRENFLVPIVLVVAGLPVAVLWIGWIGSYVFDFPVVISLLFAAMIYPADPAAIISLFAELDVPERIVLLAKGESIIDDGFAIVIFFAILSLVRERVRTGQPLFELVNGATAGHIGSQILISSAGGIVIGFTSAYAVFWYIDMFVDEPLTQLLLTILLHFGVFLFAEHYVGVSGVLAVVVSGLFAGTFGSEQVLSEQAFQFLDHTWRAGDFLVKTMLYLLIGSQVRPFHFQQHLQLVVIGALLVFLVRAGVVYVFVGATNRFLDDPVPRNYQHVMVWGTMHTVVPIALVLSLSPQIPHFQELRTMVFGVAILSVVVQGLLMPYVLDATGVTE